MTRLQTVHSVDEFKRLYYPNPDPELEYFDGHEPVDVSNEDGERPIVIHDPLDHFRKLLAEEPHLVAR